MKIGPRWNENVPSAGSGPASRGCRRQQVGRELHARERDAEDARERLGERRLADAGHVLDEHVPAREDADEEQLDDLGLAGMTRPRAVRMRSRTSA